MIFTSFSSEKISILFFKYTTVEKDFENGNRVEACIKYVIYVEISMFIAQMKNFEEVLAYITFLMLCDYDIESISLTFVNIYNFSTG